MGGNDLLGGGNSLLNNNNNTFFPTRRPHTPHILHERESSSNSSSPLYLPQRRARTHEPVSPRVKLSRTHNTPAMDFSDAFRIVNLAAAVLMVLGGVANFFPLGIQSIIIGCYCIIFGIATGLLEFQIPPQVARYASFMFSFIGRGVFYLFIGCVMIGAKWYHIAPGVITAVIGIAYIALEFVPSIEPPANMRDADAGWGAEQV